MPLFNKNVNSGYLWYWSCFILYICIYFPNWSTMTMLLSKESNSFQLQHDSETELGKQLWIRDLSLPSLACNL